MQHMENKAGVAMAQVDTSISLTTPPNFTGWGSFRVTNPAGTSPDVLNAWYLYS